MNIAVKALCFAGVAALSGCMSGPEVLDGPGEAWFLFAFPRSAECTLQGEGLRIEQNQNMMGSGFNAAGQIMTSTIVCTNQSGQQFSSTGHRELFTRGSRYASGKVYSVQARENTFGGIRSIGHNQYEFWGKLVFTPL
ncbi:hypothetical protein [Aestuariibius sp. HNIBRBA575]|uniref:hypothetical protein n=1 Tax=Aestuariibius sp. HNIBRBA575 TaxID=3233343 RepID=UPI0034A3D98F